VSGVPFPGDAVFHTGGFGGPHVLVDGQRLRPWTMPEPTLRSRYLHFSSRQAVETIVVERRLVASEAELAYQRGVFAWPVGGTWRPGQARVLRQPAEAAVLFTCDRLPDWASPREAAWKTPMLPLRHATVVEVEAARGLLDSSLRLVLRGDDDGGLLGFGIGGYRPLPRSPMEKMIPDVRGLYGELTRHEGDGWAACCSPLHGTAHWRQVAAHGLELCQGTDRADPALVFCFAMLHDAFRSGDGADPEHGRRAASALERLCADDWLRLDGRQQTILFEALADHPHGRTTVEPTIGCCWDADRLDLGRCGIMPDPALLSTPAGRAHVEQMFERGRVVPPSWRELWAAYADDVHGKPYAPDDTR